MVNEREKLFIFAEMCNYQILSRIYFPYICIFREKWRCVLLALFLWEWQNN